jgi:hypothetical protein
MEITLQLPEQIYRNVSLIAEKSKRKVVDLIIDSVQEKYSVNSLANLTNEEVLALAKLQMPKKQSERHSELLYKNQAGTLKLTEKQELDFFQQVYGAALSRKTDGIIEAVQRNLISSPAE